MRTDWDPAEELPTRPDLLGTNVPAPTCVDCGLTYGEHVQSLTTQSAAKCGGTRKGFNDGTRKV